MKPLLRRSPRSGLLGGKIVFQLEVCADLTSEERSSIAKYKLGATVPYERSTLTDRGSGPIGPASRPA